MGEQTKRQAEQIADLQKRTELAEGAFIGLAVVLRDMVRASPPHLQRVDTVMTEYVSGLMELGVDLDFKEDAEDQTPKIITLN